MKNKKNNTAPTASELSILQLLWSNGPLSVKDIHEALEREKPVVYTTVLKTMQVMMERGMLDRTSEGRKHIYRAFLDKTFGGSAKKLVMRALGQHTPDAEDLEELKAYIEALEKKE